MMPEIGIFGDQKEKLERDQAELNGESTVAPDEGEFSQVTPGNLVQPPVEPAEVPEQRQDQAELTNEQKLEQLIGG
jgi:hypothetical protein